MFHLYLTKNDLLKQILNSVSMEAKMVRETKPSSSANKLFFLGQEKDLYKQSLRYSNVFESKNDLCLDIF